MFTATRPRFKHSKGIFTGKLGLFAPWALTIAFLGFMATIGWPQQVVALSSIPNEDTWIANDTVNAIADNGTTIIIGGDFTYVGPYTGHGVPLDASSGSPKTPYPKVDGDVYAVVPDGSGGWYIGGAFARVGTFNRDKSLTLT